MSSITRRPDGQWRARYRDAAGREHARHFARKVDAQRWLDEVTTAVVTGTYVDPKTARTTVEQWCATWLEGYATRRPSTVRQARGPRRADRGGVRLAAARRGSAVTRAVVDGETQGRRAGDESYVYALHARLSQVMSDAVHDGILARNPCSRRTSPGAGQQRPYVATTEQVWALYDAFPAHLAPAVLLGAFVGLRTAEACGLRVADVDFMRGVVAPAVQWPGEPLKTRDVADRRADPAPSWRLQLSAAGAPVAGETARDRRARAAGVARGRSSARARGPAAVPGLPDGFRFHDLRHYLASLLIASGADVKVVQARLRHASAKTTLDTYGHLWPDADESARAAVGAVLAARADSLRTSGRPRLTNVRRSEAIVGSRCRSTARTRAGAGAGGSGRSRWCACSRSRSRSGPR